MNKKQFIKFYCKNSGITIEEFNKYQVALVCNCEEKKSQHFAAITKSKYLIKHHFEFNRYKHRRTWQRKQHPKKLI